MSAAVQELYPGVLGANRPAEAFVVLSCGGGLSSENQRTHGLGVLRLPSSDSSERASLAAILEGGEEAQNGGRTAAIFKEEEEDIFEEVEEETDGQEEDSFPTQERGDPRSSLPRVEASAALRNLEDETKDEKTPCRGENTPSSDAEPERSEADLFTAKITFPGTNASKPPGHTITTAKSQREDGRRNPKSGGGGAILSSVRGVSPNFERDNYAQYNEIKAYGFRIFADGESNTASGNAAWDEGTDLAEVVVAADESGGEDENPKIILLEEWGETKMEALRRPPASRREDLYGERETDHSYSRLGPVIPLANQNGGNREDGGVAPPEDVTTAQVWREDRRLRDLVCAVSGEEGPKLITETDAAGEEGVSRNRISEEQQVEDARKTLLCSPEGTQVRISEDQQVEKVTQTLLHTPEETQIPISEEQQVEDATQALLHTPEGNQKYIPEEQQVDDDTQTLLQTPEETQIGISKDQQVEDVPQTLLCAPEETQKYVQEVGDVTQTLLHTPDKTQVPISEDQLVKDATQTLLSTPEETQVDISEKQQVDDLTQTLIHSSQLTQIPISEEQQVDEVTRTLLCTPEETRIDISKDQQVEDTTQPLLRTPEETQVCNLEEEQVEDPTQTLLQTPEETQIPISEDQQVKDATQTLLHTSHETQTIISEERQVEKVTQTLLCTPEVTQVDISKDQQVKDATQNLFHIPEVTEIHISDEEQVEDATQDLLSTPEETQVRISKDQQVEDATQALLCIPEETQKYVPEEEEVDEGTHTLLHTPEETQIPISEEQQVEDATQTLLRTPEETRRDISKDQQVDNVTQTLLYSPQVCVSEDQQVEDLTQNLLRTPEETQIPISEDQQVGVVLCAPEETQKKEVTQTLLHTPEETQTGISEDQQVEDTTQILLQTPEETQIRISEEQQVEDATQALLRTPEENQKYVPEEQQVDGDTQTLLHTPEETQTGISKDQQVEDATKTLLQTPEETQVCISKEQQVEDATKTLLHSSQLTQVSLSEVQQVEDLTKALLQTPEETQVRLSEDRQVEDVTRTLLRTPEEPRKRLPEIEERRRQVSDVTQTAAILSGETQAPNESRCEIGDRNLTAPTLPAPFTENGVQGPSQDVKDETTPSVGRSVIRKEEGDGAKFTQNPARFVPRFGARGRTTKTKWRPSLELGRPLSGSSIRMAVKPAPRRPPFVEDTENGARCGDFGPPKRLKRSEAETASDFVSLCASQDVRRADGRENPYLPRRRRPPSKTASFGSPSGFRLARFPPPKTPKGLRKRLPPDAASGAEESAAILRTMSLLADKMVAPHGNALLAAEKYGRNFGRETLPETFSAVWLCALEPAAAVCVFEMRGKAPFAAPSSEWSLSVLCSRNAAFGADAAKDGGRTVARRASGLQTVLALFFPGFWRLLARKRRPPGRFPSVLRFAGSSKDSDAAVRFFASAFGGGFLPLWDRCNDPFSEIATAVTRRALGLRSRSSAILSPSPGGRPSDAPFAPPKNDFIRWELSFSAAFPIPETARTRLGLSPLPPPQFPVRPPDEPDVPLLPAFPPDSATRRREEEEVAESEKKPRKVSQIRIRKTIPKPDPNLTPMGLPRPKRLKKTEFSLEEIYTNKNYKSPPATRSLETIFEEPKERNGALVSVSQQKRKRVLEFQDFTAPRKRRARGRFTRAKKAANAASDAADADGLLIQRLTDLETFLAAQDENADAATGS